MAQHFLLSKAARTLSLAQVMRLTDDEAFEVFKGIRWQNNDGQPVCVKCGCTACYTFAARRIFKCKACASQFSVTSGTIFASRKLALRDLLGAIAIFAHGAKGTSALELSRDLNVQYKTAFVLAHKLREAMSAEMKDAHVGGKVEIDGAYFGGYVKPANYKSERQDRRLSDNQTGKRKAVVVMRERGGRTATMVFKTEAQSVRAVALRASPGTTIYADEASVWDALHAIFPMKRVNHSVSFYDNGVCTNQAESFFSRLRRAEIGTHHHISGRYLQAYAGEMAWREDHRREANGMHVRLILTATMAAPVSRQWKGYWQR